MYQTVGHALIPLYAAALGLPLYRQEIAGSAINSQRDYRPLSLPEASRSDTGTSSELDAHTVSEQEAGDQHDQSRQVFLNNSLTARGKSRQVGKICLEKAQPLGDETESLIPLLRRVIAAHPSANTVCSGAILSTYQRTRIESVARRLDLIPLSYLWQYPSLPTPFPRSAGLLDDMHAVGLDARIVKVASGGLDEELLWGNLLDQGTLGKVKRAVGRFGGSVLGEGGEFETLVLDGPAGVWKGRIEVEESERWFGRGEGGEAWVGLREGAGKVVMKEEEDNRWKVKLRKVDLWDKDFRALLAALEDEVIAIEGAESDYDKTLTQRTNDWYIGHSQTRTISTLKISNVTAANAGESASHQMAAVNAELLRILWNNDRTPTDIVFTTFLLHSMTNFSTVNSIYSNIFTDPNPPARVTVACGDSLPKGAKLMASFVIDLGARRAREGLHVQSRSYWAPANIGPYSQSISVPYIVGEAPSMVYVAGQIPLVPASMEVLREEKEGRKGVGDGFALFQKQTCLSLQHLWRIGKVMRVGWWTGAIAFIAGAEDGRRKAMLAWLAWKKIHDINTWHEKQETNSDDDLDPWDRKYGGLRFHPVDEEEKEEKEDPLPNYAKLSSMDPASVSIPPFFAVQVASLPLGCAIEWQALGLASLDDRTIALPHPSTHSSFPTHSCCFRNKRISTFSIPITSSDQDVHATLSMIVGPADITHRGHTESPKKMQGWIRQHATIYTTKPALLADLNAQIIPCNVIWGAEGVELAAVVVLDYDEEA